MIIKLDWAESQEDALGEESEACMRSLPPLWAADKIDFGSPDGLYFYSEPDRITAANSLHDNLSQLVYDSLQGVSP